MVQLSVNAARTRLSFLPTLSVEHSTASAAPAETSDGLWEAAEGNQLAAAAAAGWPTAEALYTSSINSEPLFSGNTHFLSYQWLRNTADSIQPETAVRKRLFQG